MNTPSPATPLPLFPLHSVLFPGGQVQLRVFERRYLDLIRDCAGSGRPFGVVLIAEGEESGTPATPQPVGTTAVITDFHSLPGGLLGIQASGGRRFRILHHQVQANGLLIGQVHWLAQDTPGLPIPPQFGLLAHLLHNLLEHFGDLPDSNRLLDDAAWVSWRLAELLPLSMAQRLQLLATDDSLERLQQLADWLAQL